MSNHPQTPATPQPPSSNPGPSGRDDRGRFTRGNPGGPGNPFARRIAALRRALVEHLDEATIADLTRVLLDLARRGDLAAIKLVFAYGIGKPAEAVDPDDLDVQEWLQYSREAIPLPLVQAVNAGIPARMASIAAGLVHHGTSTKLTNGLLEGLAQMAERENSAAETPPAPAEPPPQASDLPTPDSDPTPNSALAGVDVSPLPFALRTPAESVTKRRVTADRAANRVRSTTP